MSWIRSVPDGVHLTLKIVPRASKNGVAGELGDALKIRLRAPPVDGKANAALIEFLAGRLGVHERDVTLISGQTGRDKHVHVRGVPEAAARDALLKQPRRQ